VTFLQKYERSTYLTWSREEQPIDSAPCFLRLLPHFASQRSKNPIPPEDGIGKGSIEEKASFGY
jgi:hypothetical protein